MKRKWTDQERESVRIRWERIANALTSKQYHKTMGIPQYKDKARLIINKISKSRYVHRRCWELINLIEEIESKPYLEVIHGDAWMPRKSKAELKLVI